MFSKYFPFFLAIGLFSFLSGCDDSMSPINKLGETPNVKSLTVSPERFNFIASDGFKDTTLTITVSATIENVDIETSPGYVIRDKRSSALISNGELSEGSQTDNFTADINLETTTTSFEEFLIEVYAYNGTGSGNFFQSSISIEGFSNNRPVVLEVNNPDTVVRPQTGELNPLFTAKVVDGDGNATLDRVLMRIIDLEVGEPPESPYQMANDGVSFGDVSASDSIFTFSFTVTQTENRPDRDFNIEYFAIDKGGLISDTVKTTFSIRGE